MRVMFAHCCRGKNISHIHSTFSFLFKKKIGYLHPNLGKIIYSFKN